MSVKCEMCGRSVEIGAWPWCPHEPVTHFGEDPLEAYYDDNLTDEPGGIEITTRGQRRKIMNENHFEYRKKEKPVGYRIYVDMGARR